MSVPTRHDGLAALLRSLLEIIVIALFIVTFIAQPFRIPSESMEPTLRVGDFLLVDKQSYGPSGPLDAVLPGTQLHRGDLVVFHYPVEPTRHLVKRIVGLPGDRIRLRAGKVFLDETPLQEPYAFYSASRTNVFRDEFPDLREADPNVDPRWWITLRRSITDGEITVPPNQYFVLGDNRNDSEDSRYWGFVPGNLIVGRPLFVYFSLAGEPRRPSMGDAADGPAPGLGRDLHIAWKNLRVLR